LHTESKIANQQHEPTESTENFPGKDGGRDRPPAFDADGESTKDPNKPPYFINVDNTKLEVPENQTKAQTVKSREQVA
jgi:hypothetical protein